MDILRIIGIKCFGYHGVFSIERENSQKFLVDAVIGLDTKKAGSLDDIEYSINYVEIIDLIVNCIEGKPVMLIETLCKNIADNILKSFKPLFIEITVHKPCAPLAYQVKDISLTIRRERELNNTDE